MDKDAQKDFTCRMSQDEYFRYKKNWWISLNTSGRNEPMKLRSDFSEALTKLHRLHRESGEKRLAPIPSWQYQKWHPSSSSSTSCARERAVYRTGRPVVRFLHKAAQKWHFERFFVVVRSFTADSNLLQPTGGVNTTPHTSHFLVLHNTHFNVTSTLAQVWGAQRTFHVIACVIFMRSCCVLDSPRLLHFPLFAVYLLSYRPVFPPGHQLHLPRCGGQIPCALQLMRTLAPLPRTILSQNHSQHFRNQMGENLVRKKKKNPTASRNLVLIPLQVDMATRKLVQTISTIFSDSLFKKGYHSYERKKVDCYWRQSFARRSFVDTSIQFGYKENTTSRSRRTRTRWIIPLGHRVIGIAEGWIWSTADSWRQQ